MWCDNKFTPLCHFNGDGTPVKAEPVGPKKIYKAMEKKATWSKSKEICAEWGGTLASIESEAQAQDAIAEWKAFKEVWLWIGFNDLEKNHNWVWTDGSKVSYTDWLPGEPNDWNKAEHCAMIGWDGKSRWNDYFCDKEVQPLCSKWESAEEA